MQRLGAERLMAERYAGATVVPAEIDRFDALAATWWNPDGPMWPLHRLNDVRVPFIVDVVTRHRVAGVGGDAPLTGLSVLDVGCAAGLLSEAMARRGAAVTGVDPSARNIAAARAHARDAGLSIEYHDTTVDALPGGQFDVVLNMEVVEHVDQLPRFMDQCCERVRPGGLQVLATINRTPAAFISAILGAEYLLRWLPKGTHEWRKFVKPSELATLLADRGLRVVDRRGVAVNPLTRAFRLTNFEGINYMLAASRRG